MAREFTSDDRGKDVVTAEGDRVGRVSDVRDGRAHVEHGDDDSGLTDTVKSWLGWDDDDENAHELNDEHVDRVDDDRVHLRQH